MPLMFLSNGAHRGPGPGVWSMFSGIAILFFASVLSATLKLPKIAEENAEVVTEMIGHDPGMATTTGDAQVRHRKQGS